MQRCFVIAFALAACASSTPPAAPPPSPPPTQPLEQPGAPAPIVDQGTIRSRFRDCGNELVGQVLDAAGMKCADVCTAFGYSRCRGRAGQSGFVTCKGETPIVGPCDEVFEPGWASQCDCTNKPKP